MSSLFIVTKNSVRQITTAHMCIVVVANLCTHRLQGAYHQSIVTLLLLSSHQLPIISPAGVDVRNPLQLRLDFWSAWSYAGNCTCHELMHTTIILYPSVRSFLPTWQILQSFSPILQRILWELAVGKLYSWLTDRWTPQLPMLGTLIR